VRAILHSQYGASDLLQFKEIDKPAPKDNEVLIAEMVRSLGANRVIDYAKEDFNQECKNLRPDIRYRRRELFQSLPTLAQASWCLRQNIMGLTTLLRLVWTSFAGGKKLKGGVAMEHPERMNFIAELVAAGKLKAVIDSSYPLERIAEAFNYVEQGHKKGSVVITVAHP
jgi:NADPH:quinone reductase-like Zn-dependent oxidoreductase